MAGVFITRGMSLVIPSGGLTIGIGADGKPTSNLSLHVRFDVCPTWTGLAIQHLADARERRVSRQIAWAGTNEEQKATALEREFEASMQAIMAAAIAVDAFYALIKTHVDMPQRVSVTWRANRTARYSQVVEVLRRGFLLKPKGAARLKGILKDIYRFRDLAVHPSGKIEAPIFHPEIGVSVEWRFAYFHAENAANIVNASTWLLWDLAHNGKPKNPKIIEYMTVLKQRLIEMYPSGHPFKLGVV
jgi:hypothetical protein